MPRLSLRALWAALSCFALFLNLSPQAQACSVCGCGDPLLAAGSNLPMAGNFRLSLEAAYLYASAAGDGPGATEFLDQEIIRPVLVYNPSNSLALVLQLPLVRKDWWTDDAGAELKSTLNSGFGDLDLGGRWFFWSDIHIMDKWAQDMALSFGSSLPTGNSNITVDGELIDQHAQLGTGAAGPYLGLLYGLNREAWSLSFNATYRYRGTNYQGYQFGQAITFGLGGQLHVLQALALTLSLDGRYADYDHDWAGDGIDENTGGTVLNITPGFGWQIGEGFGLNARVGIPIYTSLFGTQLVTPTLDLSIQYLFSR